jgi:Uma2 family endonuclease
MALQRQLVTAEEFDEWVRLPENQSGIYELIAGRIVEKMPTNPRASLVAGRCLRYMGVFAEDENDLGYVTGADGGYMIMGERYAPDVAFISKLKRFVNQGYNPDPPDIAVEFISAAAERQSDRQREIGELLIKVSNYLAAGVEVWVVDPDAETVAIHRPGQKVIVLGADDTLTTAVLPGFSLELRKIFR